MKRLTVTLAIAALLAATPLADAAPVHYSWNSPPDSTEWIPTGGNDNWSPGDPGDYPGLVASDTAKIAQGTTQPIFSTGTITVGRITIDADVNAVDVSLVVSGGTLTISVQVIVKGRQALLSNRTATLNVTADSAFFPKNMLFWGRDHPTDSHAIFDVDGNVTVSAGTGTDTTMRGSVDVNIAAGTTFDAEEMILFNSSAHLVVAATGSTNSTLRYRSFTVNSGDFEFIGPLTVTEYD